MAIPKVAPGTDEHLVEVILEVVRAVAREAAASDGGRLVTLDDAFDRDLGLGSLERVEIVARVEDALDLRLPEEVAAAADSARDLVDAIRSARPAMAAPPVSRPDRAQSAAAERAVAAPASARTLVEVLRWHAEHTPERTHVFLREEDGGERPITYGELLRNGAAIAAGLRERGLGSGERVALMLRTEPDFFHAFFGILLAGGVPVPLYPPFRSDRIEEYARRQLAILNNARARMLLTFPEAERVARLLEPRVASLDVVATVAAVTRAGEGAPAVGLGAGDAGLIQYTSGSTGDPKGVLLTHANLLANIRAIGEAIAIEPADVDVSWLPLYHDMGLIGSWLGALYHGVPIVIISPLAFLMRPARWLQAIHAHRGTISAAPNFAFDLCVRKIPDEEMAGVDLSSWRLAFNGSEAVSPDTLERFVARFAPYGFRREALCPVYGLAESSVALTIPPVGRGPRIDAIERDAFSRQHHATPAPAGAAAPLRFVSCGGPLPGHDIRILGPAGDTLGERLEGRIEFRGPSVTSGYFRRSELTHAVLHDGWMDSGDLGYCADGELFVTGRQKDMIIKSGRNLYPQEVEDLVGPIDGVRKGCVAAFGVPDPAIGTERLVVVAESRETDPARCESLRRNVMDRVVAALGMPADVVVICPPGSVLKTSSGKIRRSATRDAYVRGTLLRRPSRVAQWLRLGLAELGARAVAAGRAAFRGVYAVYLGGLLALGLPLLAVAVRLLPPGRAVERATRVACRVLLALGGCRLHVSGRDALVGLGPAVFVANHASYLDAVVLLAALSSDVRFVAKRELLSTPLIGTILHRGGHLTVERADLERSVADAEHASAVLHGGASIAFFAEGTFVRAPGLLPFKLGAFKAAMENARPVVPVTINGTREVWPDGRRIPVPGRIDVVIGRPLRPERSGWVEMVRLRDAVRAEIERHLQEIRSDDR